MSTIDIDPLTHPINITGTEAAEEGGEVGDAGETTAPTVVPLAGPVTPATLNPTIEDAYAVVFEAICKDVVPKSPEFQQFIAEFMQDKKTLGETTAGAAVRSQLMADCYRTAPAINSPDHAKFIENQKLCTTWITLLNARASDLHEPGQVPGPSPVMADAVTDASTGSAVPEGIIAFRKVTPEDGRIRLPKALDWLIFGIPTGTFQVKGRTIGPFRIGLPFAPIFRLLM